MDIGLDDQFFHTSPTIHLHTSKDQQRTVLRNDEQEPPLLRKALDRLQRPNERWQIPRSYQAWIDFHIKEGYSGPDPLQNFIKISLPRFLRVAEDPPISLTLNAINFFFFSYAQGLTIPYESNLQVSEQYFLQLQNTLALDGI